MGPSYQHLRNKLGLEKSEASLKVGIFIGTKICELMRDDEFTSKLKPDDLAYWEAVMLIVKSFLGTSNQRAEKYMPSL